MSYHAIAVQNLGKKYQIGAHKKTYSTFREALSGAMTAPFRRLGRLSDRAGKSETFWALKDVSFELKPGEVTGIIGRNGAGKSTLLKILSQITEPTVGRIEINGRVASLLEVGTGFHPELTGRENVFLNGAILGMTRAEINRKFDEIVAFAEIDKFIDTPVKRYSSGMYVRLAFAVAAHLEPEILVVDEVLAVGDAAFQKKCLGKMSTIAGHGRTVLFVSHNMASVQNLCNRCIMLSDGKVIIDEETNKAIDYYISQSANSNVVFGGDSIMKNFALLNDQGESLVGFRPGDSVTLVTQLCPPRALQRPYFGFGIVNSFEERVTTLHTEFQYTGPWELKAECRLSVRWIDIKLCPGRYKVVAALYDDTEKIAVWDNLFKFTVENSDYFGTGKMPVTGQQGWFLSDAEWRIDSVPRMADLESSKSL